MPDGPLEPFNADQRQKVGNLGLMALEQLGNLDEDALVLDAVLCVEVIDRDQASQVHYFSTTTRAAVQRGIIEHVRDDLARFDEA